jgi:hypothetical protein
MAVFALFENDLIPLPPYTYSLYFLVSTSLLKRLAVGAGRP